jgi:hypothetical protein
VPAPSRDVVLGTVENYDWQMIRPFVASLRRSGFAGEIHLFVTDIDERTAAALRDAGVELVWFRPFRVKLGRRVLDPQHRHLAPLHRLYPHLVRALAAPVRDRTRAKARFAAPLSAWHVARFFRYLRYLTGRAATFDRVLMTDVRDVLFRRNPFDNDLGDDVWCFLEDETKTLGSEPYNREWLVDAYGEAVADTLADRPISCAGVTMGSRPAVEAYLRVLVDGLVGLPRQPKGIDQAVHNFVIHNGLVPNVRLCANGDGPVLTLGAMSSEQAEAFVTRPDARVSVLHQHDRHRALGVRLLRELAGEEQPERVLRVLVGEDKRG